MYVISIKNLQYLLKSEAGMQNSNKNGSLPLPDEDDILAFIINIKSGSIDKMKELLDKFKSNISNRLESQLRQPPLYFAVVNADEEMGLQMARSLIEAGANPNFKDANEQTALFYCCRDGKRKLVEYLMKSGSHLGEEDLYGQTPIFYIASENRLDMLDLFTTEMINHVDKLAKQTPLFYAARKGHLQMCRALIEKGCDINHLDSVNKQAVEYAKKSKLQQVVDYLTNEAKKIKQIIKAQSFQNLPESSQNNEVSRKKKKDNLNLNMNKNNYKISFMKPNGEVLDLNEEQVKELFKTNSDIQGYLANPQAIPQEMLYATLNQSWQKIGTKILNLCTKLKGASWFLEPVDPVKFGILNYFDIITKPMDFGTVKKRLNYNFYATPNDFVEDIRQVFKNCYMYNGENHEISMCAREVQNTFEEVVNSQGLAKYLN